MYWKRKKHYHSLKIINSNFIEKAQDFRLEFFCFYKFGIYFITLPKIFWYEPTGFIFKKRKYITRKSNGTSGYKS